MGSETYFSDTRFRELSPKEIEQTQAARPTIRASSSPRQREIDDIQNRDRFLKVYVDAYGARAAVDRARKVALQADAKFGPGNWKVISNGFPVIIERLR